MIRQRPQLPYSNMVAGLAALRVCFTYLFVSGLWLGACGQVAPQVLGLRLENPGSSVSMTSDGVVKAPLQSAFVLRLYGSHLANQSWPWVAFAGKEESSGGGGGAPASPGEDDPCREASVRSASRLQVLGDFRADGENSGLFTVQTDSGSGASTSTSGGLRYYYYLCVRVGPGDEWALYKGKDTVFQVVETHALSTQTDAIPVWGLVVGIVLLLVSCAVFKGLNLSLLWLDPLELYVLHTCGSEREKKTAQRLQPVRRRGNFLLCALLFLGALGQSALGVLFYRAVNSTAPAVFLCGFLVFVVAELFPHLLCSRYGFRLAPGVAWLAQLCMLLTCPLSCPLALLLDLGLGRDVSTCATREKVMDLMRSNSDPYQEFVKEEFSRGALRTKTVQDVLTPLKECFMLQADTVLDFSVMSQIMQSGYTRVPVYEEERSNIVDILYVKDLAMVDPEDRTPMSTITKFYNHPLHFVFDDTKLDAVLEEFKKGKSHLAIVQKVNNEGEGDPFYEVLGLVTLEDVIEEIIKSEILDESDMYMESKVKKTPPPMGTPLGRRREDVSLFKLPDAELKVKTSPQLLLATHRFLSREVDLFSPLRVSEKILLHLLKHPSVNQELKFDPADRLNASHYLYNRNHPVDYFILILQGRVEVEIGKEGLKFENGAFTYYGVSALTSPSSEHQSPVSTLHQFDFGDSPPSLYCPDYTVRALTDLQFVKVTRLQYSNALTASRVHVSPPNPPDSMELQIVPSSQTRLLNERNAGPGRSKSKETVTVEENPETTAGD
ncbi:metal transporter CNNM3-like isoform X2 [Polyodon spathula]|uniref:metal transporter CNNM3-like isoform X2 n=1 Tax=Polyodon spathula TaxID=7913 RepID=UPI001B7E414D|nr:metal transporter CNNM3-like isoform X2 [Polyodon spathula]